MSTRKEFRLTEFEINYIAEYARSHSCTETSAVKKIIKEHSETNETSASAFLIQEIVDGINESFHKVFTRIRLGVNNADKNSQILLELINSIYANNPDYFYVERTQEATNQATETVRKRIENYRIKRLEKEKGGEENRQEFNS